MARKLSPDQIERIKSRLPRYDPPVNDLTSGNEGSDRLNSGILSNVFDFLSRPSAAVASGVSAAVDKNPDTGVLEGILGGLSGKNKTHFNDVLGELGVKNPIARGLGGFGLDVATDPLTYVGIKGTKGLGRTEAEAQAVQRLTGRGTEIAADHVAALADEIQAANPSSLRLTFAGKKVTPEITGPSTVGNRIKDLVFGPETDRRSVAKAFAKESELPFGIAEPARVAEAKSQALYDHHQMGIKKIFDDLTGDERDLITRALANESDLGAVPLSTTAAKANPYGFTTLGDYQNFARETYKKYFDDEVALGLRKAEDYDPKYVYMYYRNPPPEPFPGLAKTSRAALGDRGRSPLLKMKRYTLDEADALGLQPVTDISEALRLRAASNYRKIGRAELIHGTMERLGVKLDPENERFLRGNNWLPVSEHIANPVGATEAARGVWLPKPVVEVLNATEKTLADGTVGSEFMKKYDNIMRQWKFMNTSMTPGYYLRNSFSDAIQNFADGVADPRRYSQARRVLADVRAGHATSLVDEIVGTAGSRTGIPAGRFVKIGTRNVPTEEVYKYYLQSGAKSGLITTEITRELDPIVREGLGRYVDRATQAGGGLKQSIMSGERKLADLNNLREDWFRMAHFIDSLDKAVGKGKALDTAIMDAGRSVRKYNIDYGALTSFEQQTVRRIVPFYAWFRRNLPLQMQMLFTKPGFMALYPKGQDLVQTLMNADDGEGDYMVPKWMRELAPVRVAMANNEGNFANKLARLATGAGSTDAVFAPLLSGMTPIGDLNVVAEPIQRTVETGSPVEGLRVAAQNVANMATPVIRAPFELATGKSTYNNQDITDWRQWALSQTGAGGRIGGMAASGQFKPYQLTSALTGAQLQPVTAARQLSEFRRREDVLRAQIRHLKVQKLQERGKEVNAKNLARVETQRTRQLSRYLKQAGKTVGA